MDTEKQWYGSSIVLKIIILTTTIVKCEYSMN